MMSRIDSRHWTISTGRHFQNCHRKYAKNQHCPISSQFDMLLNNDVLNWFPTLNNFYWSPFSKWPPQYAKNQHCPISSQFDMLLDNDVLNWFPTLNNFYWSPFSKWPPQYCKNSTLSDIKIIYVRRLWCPELIPDISTSRPFQNGSHNIAKIQHCPISSQFDMWVDNDFKNWVPILNNFYWSPFSKWPPQYAKNQHCPISSQFDMLLDNDVLNWFPTLNNFYWSPFSKWPPQYHKNSTLSDIINIWYVGRWWCPELILNIEKFLPVAIFKMATTIPQKFNIVRYHHNLICG